jgi:F-type H+-transporting ATPase subunit c
MKTFLKTAALFLTALFATVPALAQEAAHEAAASGNSMLGLAAGIAIGAAALGGALGQGKIGAAAMDGIARNPSAQGNMFIPMIIGLALIESLVIYALVIAFMLVQKI